MNRERDKFPRYYYGWNIVALTVMSQMATFGIAINCLSLYLPDWSRDLGAPVSELALCYTAPSLVFCLSAPFAGAAADRRSIRLMIAQGLFGIALLFGFASFVTRAWQLIALFSTLAPISMVIAGYVPCQALVSRWFERRLGRAIGLSALGQSMAGAILPPILAIAIPTIGWRHLFQVLAAVIAFICMPLALRFIRDLPTARDLDHREFATVGGDIRVVPNGPVITAILVRPNFWTIGIAQLAAGVMSSGFLVNLAPMAANMGITQAKAAGLLSIFSLTILGTKLASGYVIDRVGGRIVLASIVALGAAGVIVVQFAHDYIGLAAGTLLVAACGASIVPVIALTAREFGPEVTGRAMGMVTCLGVLGSLAPPVVALLRERTGSYHASMLLLAVVGGLAICAALSIRERGVLSPN